MLYVPNLEIFRSNEYFAHSRNNSGEAFQRPSSRGPAVGLGSGEYHSRNNSADVLQRPNSRGAQNTLVGAIDARERERNAIKRGLSSQAVEQEIVRRQQEAQLQQQGYPQYGGPTPQYRAPVPMQNYGEASVPFVQPQQRAQSWLPNQQQRLNSEQIQRQAQEQYLMQQRQSQQGRGQGYPPPSPGY
jgi:CCR4-NOT transcriptional complex subunit CAF120